MAEKQHTIRIGEGLWREFKAVCAKKGKSMHGLFLQWLTEYTLNEYPKDINSLVMEFLMSSDPSLVDSHIHDGVKKFAEYLVKHNLIKLGN